LTESGEQAARASWGSGVASSGSTNGSQRLKLVLVGDSIAAGLGVRDSSYGAQLAEHYNLEFVDLSASAMTAPESEAIFRDSTVEPTLLIVAHGITEAILRPAPTLLRVMPIRWQRTGWMDPRPYFSRSVRRRLIEKLESGLRWRVKNLLLRLAQPVQIVEYEQFVSSVARLTRDALARGAIVVLLGPPRLDERYFPGSSAQMSRYFEGAVEAQGGEVQVVRIEEVLSQWSDYCADHFHPNDLGHRAIAAHLRSELSSTLKR
jgi:lysophospholipase L1-like esterase